MDDEPSLAQQFRTHFGHRNHLYGVLLDELADDLDSGGPTADICRNHHSAARGDVVQLRLLAGIFRIVLRGDAPELVRFYPSLGGAANPEDAWQSLRPVLVRHAHELRRALDIPPQTNEVGRSACLAVGLFEAVRRHGLRQVRLLELGASAGLNLNVDRYRFIGPDWCWGPIGSPVTLDTAAPGVCAEDLTIVSRRGCDLAPIDLSDERAAEYLTSFVWPFDVERHHRLAAAIDVARRHPVSVDRAPASAWILSQLAQPMPADVLTVVWQSITGQYWPASEQAAVADALAEARGRLPLSHVSMEGIPPAQGQGGYVLDQHGPTICLDDAVIAKSHHHGPPITLV